jgi:uncharacterized membrane protein
MIDRWSSYVLRGLIVVLPIWATVWVLRSLFLLVDHACQPTEVTGGNIPGLGFLIILVLATVLGFLADWSGTSRQVQWIEHGLARIPLVKLVYGTIKDFVDAFLGKKRRFDKPVLVQLGGAFDAQVVGFVTSEDLSVLGISAKVAVYFPQSYTIGGNLVILSRDRVTPIDADSGAVMAFLVSGGVTRTSTTEAHRAPLLHGGDQEGSAVRVADKVRGELAMRGSSPRVDRHS